VLLTTSTSPQPSNGKVTAASDQEGENEKTEERYDVIKYGMNKTVQLLPKVRHRFDNCSDIRHPSINISSEAIKNALLDIKNRGVKSRFITEITKDNLHYCKELMEVISELRHIDGVKGNFAVTDTEYVSYAIPSEKAIPSQKEKVVVIRSTSKEFVEQQQYLFDILWNKAVPAERKIMEMESGIMLPERTEIITGADNIHRLTLASAPHIRESLNTSIDSNAPRSLTSGFMWNYMKELASTKKGVRFRYIAEITKDNLPYCKEMAKVFELRHLDSIKGNLSIIDGREYRASPSIRPGAPPDVLIRSTSKVFVEQQQFFFETLWNKALPAEKRIREIEEGIKPEIIETIREPKVTQERVFELIKSANEEILIIFSTSNAFRRQVKAGTIDLIIRTAKSKNVKVRILSPVDDYVRNLIDKIKRESKIRIDIRNIEEPFQTKVSVLIVDRASLLSAELKSDSKETTLEAIGLTTYSNSRATVLSYASIFESLWKITEFAENLRIANIKLEGNEKAMKEFINIAAHELRTPLQPILGLSEMLSNARNDPQQHGKFVEIIVRNAHKLENLAEDILDVTRIESGKLKLVMEKVDLHKLVESVVHDFQRFLPADGKVKMNYQKLSDGRNDDDDHGMSRLAVLGDPERIAQVLSNLLGNALKFTKEGTINVRVGRTDSPSSSEAIVSISDSGQGIDPEVMHKLFEKFTSKSESGTGLGLFLSKSIVEAHGGKIWGENNKDGNGATFTFTLPLAT
jgi:two-component system sensor histidine kinase VicK